MCLLLSYVTELGISFSQTTIDGTEYPRYCKVYQQHSWWLRSSYLPSLNNHSYGIYGPGQSYHPTGGCSTITDYIKNADLICTIRLG